MSRELKRVPLDFNWPTKMIWKGYLNPYQSQKCKLCDGGGYNAESEELASTFHYGWELELTQDEVDVLVAKHRLVQFTSHWTKEGGWVENDPPTHPTAEQVNEWCRSDPGKHDSINRCILVEVRGKRLGIFGLCPLCEGHGSVWFNDAVRKLNEDWYENERYAPPKGEGYQVWETTSEGSPISPVFRTSEECIEWLVTNQRHSREGATKFVMEDEWAASSVMVGGKWVSGIDGLPAS